MTRLHEERDELRLLIRDRTPDEKTVLTEQDLAEDIERWSSLSRQARSVLSKARWLPLTLEKQTTLAEDPLGAGCLNGGRTSYGSWCTSEMSDSPAGSRSLPQSSGFNL